MKKVLMVSVLSFLAIYLVSSYFLRDTKSHLTTKEIHQSSDFYSSEVQPVFDSKCIACHSCYNSPCQLNLTSYSGSMRGANKVSIYDFPKFKARKPTRMFVDAIDEKGWRDKGFYKIYDVNDPKTSILSHMISELDGIESGKQNKFESEKSRVCVSDPSDSSISSYKKVNPAGRMPFGLPALSRSEIERINKWQSLGMPGPKVSEQENKVLKLDGVREQVKSWESFFNKDGLKSQLSSRYIYEHLFLAHIYFTNFPNVSFKLVRSKTMNGDIIEIATVYPFDDPKEKFFYRLRPVVSTIVHKSHLPFEFNDLKKEKWKKDFYESKWENLPSKMPEYGRAGANPYLTFKDIPVSSRYRFFLDEANYHIMTFIKGPVCRGQTALNVINDHFWVLFIDPSKDPLTKSKQLYNYVSKKMVLPAQLKDDFKPMLDLRKNYWSTIEKKFKYLENYTLDSNWLWTGNKSNSNSAITVMRHFDSAHVMKGLQGRTPKTVWVLDYHVFESIYYNLTSGYNVFGPMLHQLNSRLFMELSRISSEDLFLSFLPVDERMKMRQDWNQDVPRKKMSTLKWISEMFTGDTAEKMKFNYAYAGMKVKSSLEKSSNNSKEKFLQKIKTQVLSEKQVISNKGFLDPALESLAKINSKVISHLPDSIILKYNEKVYTLIHHKDHYNVSMLLFEDERRNTDNDSIDIIPGVVASYPNLFMLLDEQKLLSFIKKLKVAKSSQDTWKVLKEFSLSRGDKEFWKHYEYFSKHTYEKSTNEFGYLDLNRYLNI